MDLISAHSLRLWLCYKVLPSLFSKGLQPFDSIKCTLIQKLAYKIKYNCQIKRGLILFFRNLRIRFF